MRVQKCSREFMWELSLGVMPYGGLRHSVAELFVKPSWEVSAVLRLSQLPFRRWHNINLVDPASSHMLVSKIKPCMSQYKLLHGETANGSLKQLSFIWWSFITWITMVILELIHAPRPDFVEGLCLLGTEPT